MSIIISMARSSGMCVPARSTFAKLPPETYSITTYGPIAEEAPSFTKSTWTTLGCLICWAVFISLSRAILESASASAPSGSSLTATTRPDVSPTARYTSPNAPWPKESVVLNVSLSGPENVVPIGMDGIVPCPLFQPEVRYASVTQMYHSPDRQKHKRRATEGVRGSQCPVSPYVSVLAELNSDPSTHHPHILFIVEKSPVLIRLPFC